MWRGKTCPPFPYGYLNYGGKQVLAHRASYEVFNGAIPDGLHVRHKSDIPLDVNPHNLELGTQTDNMADKVARNRQLRGDAIPHSKLTEDDVRRARELWRPGEHGYGSHSLAVMFGVSQVTMYDALVGRNWKHVV
jgi:hypothetical protein